MFLVSMLYLFGVMAVPIACAYTTPAWAKGADQPSGSDPSALLVAGLFWPLLLVGALHFGVSAALYKVEVHRAVHASLAA
ncbi:hypothetical protein [Mycolicibacterium komossense]|uniref:Uncharacterized protein n=1 Tax=Mycolicibacterium komossense TaxID=1779 RepID=A0ABT3CHK7_9MYCO|nr:hypothetical protein [Mycolicibacterium komossense]MCV7228940.1 hypothetical protein [Mycolicibacterium komossense]